MYATESQNYEVNESIRILWLTAIVLDLRSFKLIISEKGLTIMVFEKGQNKSCQKAKNISPKILSGENTPIQIR